MVRASNRYREVMGSNPVQVLDFFFQALKKRLKKTGSYAIVRFQKKKKTGSCMEVRLTSPRGKFKITNMADDQVDLTPEAIPGASFIEEEIEKLTVSQLKFWLKCLR